MREGESQALERGYRLKLLGELVGSDGEPRTMRVISGKTLDEVYAQSLGMGGLEPHMEKLIEEGYVVKKIDDQRTDYEVTETGKQYFDVLLRDVTGSK